MRSIVRLVSLVMILCFGVYSAQDKLSEGFLNVENKGKFPVKIYSSDSLNDTYFVFKNNKDDILVILNRYNLSKPLILGETIKEFEKDREISVLDENFKKVDDLYDGTARYILRSEKLENINDYNVKLETEFLIWNSDDGLNIWGFSLKYYSLMFVFAFAFGLLIMKWIFRTDAVDEKYLDPLFSYTLLGTIFGARIGHVLFYEAHLFIDDFWSVFLPIRTKPTLEFTGFAGLASHGAAIALLLTTLYFSLKVIKKNPLWVYDRLGIVIALAGFFIRIGNFFNSEIIGKPAEPNSFLAVYFPNQSLDYGAIVPRYPTQLIEAVAYLVLFIVLISIYKFTTKKLQEGWLFGLFFSVLWSIRFFTEFLKEPQGDEYISFLGMNTGQILSLPFILIGILVLLYSRKNKV